MDIKWIVLVAIALLLGTFLAFGPSQGPQSNLVIAEGAANQIALVNGNSGQLTAIPAGSAVHGVGVLPDGKIAYAASNDNTEVSVIDLVARKTIAQIDVGGKSHHITVCPHGKHVFVTVGSANSVAVIDPGQNTEVAQITEVTQIPVGEMPSYAVLTPDETKLYVTNMGSNTVSVIDTSQLKVIATVEVGKSPDHAAATPDGRLVYVTNGGSDSVSVIDTNQQQVVMTIPVGKGPHGVAVAGKYVYVGNRGATTLSVIDPATNQVVRTVELGTSPEHITAAPDGRYLYIGSNADKSILVFDTTTDRVTKKIKIGSEVHQIALIEAPAAHQHAVAVPTQPAKTFTEADLTRTSKAASIEVNVVFMNPLLKSDANKDQLTFKIALDTHAGDLMQYDLTQLAVLRTSTGVNVDSGFIWEPGSESSHHRSGVLKLTGDVTGKILLAESTEYLELELKGIGVPSRTFKWTKQELSGQPLSGAELILEKVQREIIPVEGSSTAYGVTFSEAGYQTLVAKNKELQVPPEKVTTFEGLDLTLPCCAFKNPSADESKNCACEHHQMVYGLAKDLLAQNYTPQQVQQEVGRWHHYLYPKESLRAEMERRGQNDPKIKAALEELKAKGKC
jgi:YVTN family beta-propeller protein